MIWIDKDINSKEKSDYIEELSYSGFKTKKCKEVMKAIKAMKFVKFEVIKIIIDDELYSEFVKIFKENLKYMLCIPAIIIFTKNKKKFLENNKDYKNNKFYNFGGVVDTFKEVKKFLNIKEYAQKKLNNSYDVEYTFEFIDKKEKLLLPLFYKTLIDNISNDNMEKYTSTLYKDYVENNQNSKDYNDLKNLLGSIKSIPNIPIEILSKYYARVYTAETNFYKDIISDLNSNKVEKYGKYLPYIKTLYEGVKLKSLPLASNNILYRGAKISHEEINKIKGYLKKKIKDLPSSIVFSKAFLSFSKDKKIAEGFLSAENKNKNLFKVLFVLENDDNVGYNLATHCDIENISYFPNEKEVYYSLKLSTYFYKFE